MHRKSINPLSIEFSRQEFWSGLPFPTAGDLPNPGIKIRSPALQPGKPWCVGKTSIKSIKMQTTLTFRLCITVDLHCFYKKKKINFQKD